MQPRLRPQRELGARPQTSPPRNPDADDLSFRHPVQSAVWASLRTTTDQARGRLRHRGEIRLALSAAGQPLDTSMPHNLPAPPDDASRHTHAPALPALAARGDADAQEIAPRPAAVRCEAAHDAAGEPDDVAVGVRLAIELITADRRPKNVAAGPAEQAVVRAGGRVAGTGRITIELVGPPRPKSTSLPAPPNTTSARRPPRRVSLPSSPSR